MSRLSLKYRIALTILLLESVMVGLVLWRAHDHLLEETRAQISRTDHVTLRTLVKLAHQALLTEEYGALHPYMEDLGRDPRVLVAMLADAGGRVVSSSDCGYLGGEVPAMPPAPDSYWLTQRIENRSGYLGTVGIRFSAASLAAAARDSQLAGLSIALPSMMAIAVVGLAMGHVLTRRLGSVAQAARRLAAGDRGVRVLDEGGDEVAQLGRDFNTMVLRVQEEILQRGVREEQYRTLLGNIPGVVYRCGVAHPWKVEHISEEVEALTGFPAAAFLAGAPHYGALVVPEDTGPVGRAIEEAVARREPFDIEYRIRCRDGGVRWVHERGRATYDDGGRARFLDGVILDVTARREAEEEKRRLDARLLQARKLESLGLVAGGVAHDLNNILTGVVVYPDMLLRRLEADSELRPCLERIRDAGERAASMVQDILSLARGVSCRKEEVDLNRVVEGILDSVELARIRELHPEVEVHAEFGTGVPVLTASRGHVAKLLLNLVVNAHEAIAGKGTVSVSTDSRRFAHEVPAWPHALRGEYAVLCVRDTGCGIDAGDVGRIFEPFFTRKIAGRSGTGLGLTVVWNVVLDHGGAIEVHSGGAGTTFTVFLPVAAGREAAEEAGAGASAAGGQRGRARGNGAGRDYERSGA